jgi:urea transport system permease protein
MKPNISKRCFLSIALLMLLILLVPSFTLGEETVQVDVFNEALTKLIAASMQERSAAVEQLAAVQEPRAIVILQALLDGHLLKLKNDGKRLSVQTAARVIRSTMPKPDKI